MGRQACPLGAERVLDHLHEHLLAVVDELGDVLGRAGRLAERAFVALRDELGVGGFRQVVALRLQGRADDVRGVKKRGALEADVDEGGLHAGQHATHPAFVDVADQTAPVGALDERLLEDAILDHGNPGFPGRDVDEQLGTQAMVPFSSPGAPLPPRRQAPGHGVEAF